MTIGIVEEVRKLTGISDIEELSDDDIQKAIKYGKGELYAVTFKTDWDDDINHPLFYKAETLVHYFASFNILDRYSGNFEKANTHRSRASGLASELKTEYDDYVLVTTEEGVNTKFSVAVSKYKSYPLNPDAEVHRSTTIIPGE